MMSAVELLKVYKDIDTKIQFERDIIQSGQLPGGYVRSLFSELPQNVKVRELQEQFRELEWQTLMEYRRLVETKFICWKAMSGLSEVARGVLVDRAACGMSLPAIADKYHYSESQVKRIFKQVYKTFLSEADAISEKMTPE